MIYNIYFDCLSGDYGIKIPTQLGQTEKFLNFKQSTCIIMRFISKFAPTLNIKPTVNLPYDFFNWLCSLSLASSSVSAHVQSIDFNMDGHLLFHIKVISDSITINYDLPF